MFLLHELTHIVLSLIVGWIFFRYAKSTWIFIVSFLGGFFLDVDHLFDYFRFKGGFAFNLKEFIASGYFDAVHKVFLPFHGYEYAIILLVAGIIILSAKPKPKSGKSIFAFCFITIAASMFLHLVFDQISYQPNLLAYSIIYRAEKNFDHDNIGFKKHYEK